MERDEPAATERSDAKILRRYARCEPPAIDEWLAEDVEDMAIRFLLEPVERRHMDRSAVPCTQYSPADWHGRLGGGVQADAMIDRPVHGAVRIDLDDVDVRKLLSEKKWRYAPAKRVIRKRRGHQYRERETCGAHVAK